VYPFKGEDAQEKGKFQFCYKNSIEYSACEIG